MKQHLNDFGDTIVEVLIASAVIGFILVGGYVAVNHNVTAEQQAQDRATALQLDQIQLEKLQALVVAGGLSLPTNTFCIGGSDFKTFEPPTQCFFNSSDVWSQNATSVPSFVIVVTPNPTINQYTVTANWVQEGTKVSGSATLEYRFFPSIANSSIPTGS